MQELNLKKMVERKSNEKERVKKGGEGLSLEWEKASSIRNWYLQAFPNTCISSLEIVFRVKHDTSLSP